MFREKRLSCHKRKVEKKREEIIGFIVQHKVAHDGNSPSIREIGDACGISSTSAVNYYLAQLVKLKKIRKSHKPRSIEIVGGYMEAAQ